MNLTPCSKCDWYRRVSHAGADCDMHQRLATLASNLAVGAALCAAFWQGVDEAEEHALYHKHGYREDGCWCPGCGKEAP